MRLVSARPVVLSVLVALLVGIGAWAQAQGTRSDDSSLQSLYDASVRLQKAGDLGRAAAQYREFLASALDKLAVSRAQVGEYANAFALFDEALALTPSSPAVRLDLAAAALQAGDLQRAKSVIEALLMEEAQDPGRSAAAHQLLGRVLHKMNQDQDARKELEAAVALDPGFANEYNLAVICLDLDDEQCAVRNFERIEAAAGDSPELHMQIGLAYGNSDFTPRAVAEFRKVIAEDPRYPGAHYCVAAALLAAGDDEKTLQQAEAELKEELTISPNDFLTYAALGKIEAGYHRRGEAEQYLKRAIALNPKNPDAFLYLGQMYFDANRSSDAEPKLRKAIELTTDVSRNHFQIQKAHFLLGRILMQQHRQEEAHAEMQIARTITERALKKDRNNLSGMLQNRTGNAAYSDVPADSAVTLPADSTLADPGAVSRQREFEKQLIAPIADGYNNLGAITASQTNYAYALKYFKRAAAWNPSLAGLDYNLGHAAFLASEFSEAIPPLTRYLSSHPGDSSLRGALAMSEFMVHRYSDCIRALKGAGPSITSIPQMEYIYAESLVKTGQVAAGKRRLEALEAAHPEIAEVHRSLGEIAALRRDWQKAIRKFTEANELKADDAQTKYDLGKAYLATGRTAQAIAALEMAARLMPAEAAYHEELAMAYERAFRMSDAEKERHAYEQIKASQPPAAHQGASTHTTNLHR
jgi:tetratricopeptide (TPR) repeat protein